MTIQLLAQSHLHHIYVVNAARVPVGACRAVPFWACVHPCVCECVCAHVCECVCAHVLIVCACLPPAGYPTLPCVYPLQASCPTDIFLALTKWMDM
jgi:hypothetical protein